MMSLSIGISLKLGQRRRGPSFLLDQFPGAAAAYSLRALSADTTAVVRVRRSSDNTEADFTPAQIGDGSLLAWVGTGGSDNGFVTTWYDQSGNTRDVTQTTAGNQPKIVDAGSLVTEGGRPALLHDRSTLEALITTSELQYTAFLCARQSDIGTTYFYQLNNDGVAEMSLRGSPTSGGSGSLQLRGSGSNEISFLAHATGQRVISALQKATSELFYDGNLVASGNTGSTGITHIGIGRRFDALGFNYVGKYSEFILFLSDQSADRDAIEQNIASHYGITLA